MTGEHRIVVLGAGYAGLSAAGKAARARGARVTVIDTRAELVERVRLHQALTGQRIPSWQLGELLERKGIEFIRGRVVEIDPAARLVHLEGDWSLSYDSLVYALGSKADTGAVPGATEHAYPVATPEDVARVPALSGRVAVVGGGSTGIETAAELAEARPDLDIHLVSSEDPGAWLSPKAHNHIRKTLDRLGVRVHAGEKVAAVTATGLELVDGTHLPAETVLWATGFAVPAVAARSGLAVDARGRILVDAELRSRSHPEIYVAGDSAVMPGPGGREMRMACATAQPSGKYAAAALTARLAGKEPAPNNARYIAQCISLGRHDGVFQRVHADDSLAGTVLTGRTAAWVKERIVRGAGWAARP
ncbi:oxidoreductase [Nocardia sp. SYP-A9097]|uniref:NAD(P)/FAD-dependent oxidoreductase n=1 Tax=Nocardia sp. SYP-A9097 TaxID=2663237 RepID=UPI00129B3A75|nr:FAD-dependent oxidoreductase [Nocardia sp. SYP-A9097]MRH91977.1 oxidoreductase [Nocardia sp. SYP-A9097]